MIDRGDNGPGREIPGLSVRPVWSRRIHRRNGTASGGRGGPSDPGDCGDYQVAKKVNNAMASASAVAAGRGSCADKKNVMNQADHQPGQRSTAKGLRAF